VIFVRSIQSNSATASDRILFIRIISCRRCRSSSDLAMESLYWVNWPLTQTRRQLRTVTVIVDWPRYGLRACICTENSLRFLSRQFNFQLNFLSRLWRSDTMTDRLIGTIRANYTSRTRQSRDSSARDLYCNYCVASSRNVAVATFLIPIRCFIAIAAQSALLQISSRSARKVR